MLGGTRWGRFPLLPVIAPDDTQVLGLSYGDVTSNLGVGSPWL